MILDIWALLLVAIFAIGGAVVGLSGQAARLLALAGATVAALLTGSRLGGFLPALAPRPMRTALAAALVGIVVYLLLSSLLRSLLRRIFTRGRGVDRLLGGALGAAQGGYLAYLFALLLPVVNLGFRAAGSRLYVRTEGSRLARFAALHPLPLEAVDERRELRRIIDRVRGLPSPGVTSSTKR